MKKLLIAIAVSGACFTSVAQAGTATGTMAVSATVSGTCKITTAPTAMAFGTIDPSTVAADVLKSSTFQYKCTNGLAPTGLGDDLGLNEVGTQMKMKVGAALLNYGIVYTKTGLAAGNGFGTGSTANTITVDGTILLTDAQNAAAGAYVDTVTFTLSF